MIKWFFKYGAVLFIFNTFFLSIIETRDFAFIFFVLLLISYSVFLAFNPLIFRQIIFNKAFSFFLLLNILNFSYFLIFHSFNDLEAIKYISARFIQFSIISFSVYYNYDYFKLYFLKHMAYVILIITVLGLIVDPFIFSSRHRGIVWNPNMLSNLTTTAFAALFLMKEKLSIFHIVTLSIFFLVSLSTGSRAVLIAFFFIFLVRFGFSKKNMLFGVISLFIFFVLYSFDYTSLSVNRFASQNLFNDRILQYLYSFETILQKPFIGYGLDKYAYISSDLINDDVYSRLISAHNGYLAILVQYGLIFGLITICIILYKIIYLFQKSNINNPNLRFYFFIILYVPIGAIYETYFTGINEFLTVLFWFSLAYLSLSIKKNEV